MEDKGKMIEKELIFFSNKLCSVVIMDLGQDRLLVYLTCEYHEI